MGKGVLKVKHKSGKIGWAIGLTSVTLILILLVSSVYAAHYHYWVKMSQTTVTDRWGNQVEQCIWQCDDMYNNVSHTTVTQGHGWCPNP